MTVIGLLFIGAVLGWGCGAIWYQRVREEAATLRQALAQANAETSAANHIIDAQRDMLAAQNEFLELAKDELRQLSGSIWPAQPGAK